MIICKKSLNSLVHRIDSVHNCDITLSIFDSNIFHGKIYFVSFYKPSNIKFKISHWRDLFDLIDSIALDSQFFILGDFNSQNRSQ